MKLVKQKFRLLMNAERLEAALATEHGRAEAKKQLGIFIGRPDEDIDAVELREQLEEMREKLGHPNALPRSVRENYFAYAGAVVQVAEVVTPERLAVMHGSPRETLPTIDYDHFGDRVLETLDTDARRENFLRVFNSATFERTFRLLMNKTRLNRAVSEDKETLKHQVDVLFDLGGVFDRDELNTHADAMLAHLGEPATMTDAAVREKCEQARALVDQCRHNLLETGAVEALFSKPLKMTAVDYDRFGDQLLEEVIEPEDVEAFLSGFRFMSFENSYRILLSNEALSVNFDDDPKEVKGKIDQLFDLSGRYGVEDVARHTSQMSEMFKNHIYSSAAQETKAQQLVEAVQNIAGRIQDQKILERLYEKPKEKEIDVEKFGEEIINIKEAEVIPALRSMNMFMVAARYGRLRDEGLVKDLLKTQEGKKELRALLAQFFGVSTQLGINEIQAFKDQFETKCNPGRVERSSVEFRNFSELAKFIQAVAANLSGDKLQKIYKEAFSRKKTA